MFGYIILDDSEAHRLGSIRTANFTQLVRIIKKAVTFLK